MTRYLVVAHQTATNPELLDRVSELAADDPNATFTILVPTTPPAHFFAWEEGEAKEIARRRAHEASAGFERGGAKVVRTEIGDASPLLAMEDELRTHPGEYDAIILSTLPPGISRWLLLDVHNQAERRFGLPVIHVMAQLMTSGKDGSSKSRYLL